MTVKEFMVKSGTPLHLKGYEFLKTAIELHVEDPERKVYHIMEEVAKKNEYSLINIEKNLKTAIVNGFDNMDKDIKSIVFKNVRPTTAKYIRSVSYAIRNNLI